MTLLNEMKLPTFIKTKCNKKIIIYLKVENKISENRHEKTCSKSNENAFYNKSQLQQRKVMETLTERSGCFHCGTRPTGTFELFSAQCSAFIVQFGKVVTRVEIINNHHLTVVYA